MQVESVFRDSSELERRSWTRRFSRTVTYSSAANVSITAGGHDFIHISCRGRCLRFDALRALPIEPDVAARWLDGSN